LGIFNDKYYSIKHFEREGKIYEIIGIKWFKRLLLRIVRSRKNKVPFNGYFLNQLSIEGISEFEKKVKEVTSL
jgi:hypothetical protein